MLKTEELNMQDQLKREHAGTIDDKKEKEYSAIPISFKLPLI